MAANNTQHTVCKEMLDILPFGVYAVDVKTDSVVYANRQWRANHAEMGHAPCYSVINGRDSRCTYCRRSELLDEQGLPNGVTLTYEFFNEFDDKWYQICESATYWDNNQVVKYVIAVDISDLKETQNRLAEAHAELALKNKELEYLANTDSLTRIYNRDKLARVFARELENLAVHHNSFAIISIDLDHFKEINDTFGHAVGDNVLISVARTMKDAIRATDIIGRWGGEEFLILCPATNLDEARHLSQRICDEVARSRYCTGRAHSVSIGVAAYRAGDTLDSLLQRADLAMYRAKQNGRNRVCSEADS
jgi:diguanylate cyclase (GGDEF)-like protein